MLKHCNIDYDAYQIVVDRTTKDRFTFKIAVSDIQSADTEKFLEDLYKERPLLLDAINDGTNDVPNVVWCKAKDLEYNPRTGKLKVIVDKRV